MNPEIFVLSAGYAREHDYRWKTVTSDKHDLAEELRERFAWLDDEHPSILVERDAAGSYRVLVAGLATGRRDCLPRDLRNAILWLNLSSDAARALTSKFLRTLDRLAADCNAAVVSEDSAPGGFTVNWEALRRLAVPAGPALATDGAADARCWELPQAEVTQTLEDIERSGWPAEPNVLLVVTRLPTPAAIRALRELPVWRLHHEQAVRGELPPKAMPRKQSGPPLQDQGKQESDLKPLLLGALIALLLVWIVWPTRSKKAPAPADSGGQLSTATPSKAITPVPTSSPTPVLPQTPTPGSAPEAPPAPDMKASGSTPASPPSVKPPN